MSTLRPSTLGAGIFQRARGHVRSTQVALTRLARTQSFKTPTDAEAAVVRAVRNLACFRMHYAVMQWVVLLLVLGPSRPGTVFFLMVDSKVAALCLTLSAAFPNSVVLHRVLHRGLVFGLLLVVVLVQLAIAHAIQHLFLSLAVGAPIIICHALFRSRDDDISPPVSSDSAGSHSHEDDRKATQILHVHDKSGDHIDLTADDERLSSTCSYQQLVASSV